MGVTTFVIDFASFLVAWKFFLYYYWGVAFKRRLKMSDKIVDRIRYPLTGGQIVYRSDLT